MSSANARHHPILAHGQARHGTQPGRSSALSTLRKWLRLTPANALHTGTRDTAARSPEEHRSAQFAAADRMLRRAADEDVPVTVLVLELHDLPELEYLFGERLARQAVAKTSARLRQVAGRGSLVLHLDAITSAVLLPCVESEEALERLHAAFGKPCAVELDDDDDGEDVVLVPDFALQTVDSPAVSFASTCDALRRQIEEARAKSLQRQAYLQRERESHTRPMGLTPSDGPAPVRAPAAARETCSRVPPTMPMPPVAR